MDAILKNEAGAKTTAARLGFVKQAQTLAAKDAPIIPYWQGAMLAVGRSNIRGIAGDARPDVHHAVLGALEVLVA